jgi:hypothetical protein
VPGEPSRRRARGVASGGAPDHLADAGSFVVYPAGVERGTVLLDGRWSAGEVPARAEVSGS